MTVQPQRAGTNLEYKGKVGFVRLEISMGYTVTKGRFFAVQLKAANCP